MPQNCARSSTTQECSTAESATGSTGAKRTVPKPSTVSVMTSAREETRGGWTRVSYRFRFRLGAGRMRGPEVRLP
ncbi:hypothetical protein GCM10010425_21940 [Streptomyces spororaveus]|uniref:Uncharacterized protein n=1 Tax=Streptomyces spororaveus TaxID=284039 RepID=A0ABQ3TQD2_9ACTN|nr:hypothetical protein Sspor_81670 [Streptomyces spororaveus]